MQAVLLVLVDAVLLQHTRTARAVADAKHGAVDGEDGVVAFLQLVVMTHGSYVLRSVVEGRERERLVNGCHTHFPAGSGGEFHVGGLTVVATILRHRVMGVLIRHL